jgi:hypothetical protein
MLQVNIKGTVQTGDPPAALLKCNQLKKPKMPRPITKGRVTFVGVCVLLALHFSHFLEIPVEFDNLGSIKEEANEIQNSYDFIVVGGGQSGLTVANRLSEDSKSSYLFLLFLMPADRSLIDVSSAQILSWSLNTDISTTMTPALHALSSRLITRIANSTTQSSCTTIPQSPNCS